VPNPASRSEKPAVTDESIFAAALAIASPAERAAYLDRACATDAGLRRQVEELLAAHAADNPLDRPPADLDRTGAYEPPAERPGASVGPYKLLQEIGEGGMGTVFMAEQTAPVRRKVALKIIKPGMDSRQVVARFEAERQALSLMDHPNIARVLDAGATASGRPFFVMELVHGVPIIEFCDANKLTPRQRLGLFVPVCQAIQHAHQKGIIHRDIKPGNILVTMYDDRPVPKVIDFGVAKAVEQRLTERTLFTQFGALVGTFEYMSPEQAEMNAFGVDTRSDVYSLGVLLYELLTGTTPLERQRLRGAALGEVVRLIKEEEPPRPSLRLSTSDTLAKVAAARQTEPAKLSALVRGELDWIVMRCLEKDRTRRYDTASALARDVERYLHDEPVEACPPTVGYRLRKLARKYKKPLTAAAVFALLLLAGAVVSAWQAVRARQAETAARAAEEQATKDRDRARAEKENTQAALDFLWRDVFTQFSPVQTPGQHPEVRRLLDRAAEQLDAASDKPPLVQASIRRMIGQIYLEVGDFRKARRHLELALEVQRRELGEKDVQALETMHQLGRCLLWSNQYYDEAAPVLTRTLELSRLVLGEGHRDTLGTMVLLGVSYAIQGRYEEGERLLKQAHEGLSGPTGDRRQGLVALIYLGTTLAAHGQLDQAEAVLADCLAQTRKDRDDANWTNYIAGVKRALAGVYIARDDPARAESPAEEALKGCRSVLGEQHLFTLHSLGALASAFQLQGQYDKAAPLLKEAQNVCRGLQIEEGPRLASLLGMLGENLLAEKKYADAEAHLRQCLTAWDKRLPHGGLALTWQAASWEYAWAQSLLGASLLGQKKYNEAQTQLRRGYEGLTLPQQAGEARPTPLVKRRRVEALGWLVRLYDEWNKPDEAAKWRKELETVKAAVKPAASP
jgi:serine/threonine protein kinase/tetratricopeptide (TPR) repeat protein